MTQTEILDHAAILVSKQEGFSAKPYWDRKRWSWGYGTKAPGQYGTISVENALKEMREHLRGVYLDFIQYFPELKTDALAVPLMSKAYQYGTGIFKSLRPIYVKSGKEALIQEAFVNGEPAEFIKRRKAELKYYADLQTKQPEGLYFALVAVAIAFSLVTLHENS